MFDGRCGVLLERYCPLEFLRLFLFVGLRGPFVGEALLDIFDEGNLLVERLEVEAAVGVESRLIGYGVADEGSLDCGAAVPLVCGVIADVGGQEVE